MHAKVKVISALVLSALSFTFVAPVPTFAALPTANILIDPGNVSTYSGSGTTVNSIGSASATGTMNNVTYSATNGGTFIFTGSSSYINFSNAYQFGDNFTITAWVKQSGTPSQIQALMANTAGGGNSNGFKAFWNEYNTNNRKMVLESGNGSANGFSNTGSATVAASGWQHLTFVVSRTSMTTTMYLNGISQSMGTNSLRNDFATNQAWFIGAFTDGTFSLNGSIGVFKVFNSALSASDVADDFNQYSVRYIAQNPVITASASFSMASPATYRTPVTVTVNSNAAGKIGLRANGKWIPGCRQVAITTTATCTFKPSIHGAISITGVFTPANSASFNPATFSAPAFGVQSRSNKR